MLGKSRNHIQKNRSAQFNHHYIGHKRSGVTTGTAIIAVVFVIFLYIGLTDGTIQKFVSGSSIPISTGATTTTTVGTSTGSNCQNLPLSSSNFLKTEASHYSGDGSLSSATANIFSTQGTSLVQFGVDDPGSLTDGTPVTSSNTYSLTQGLVTRFNATGAYPIWAPLNGASITEGGVNVYSVTSTPSSSNPSACNWVSGATLIQAPGSGTSATTNVKTLVVSSTGATLTTASTALPTSPTLWNVELQISQAYKGALYPTVAYGTQANPITNYATGQTTTSGAVTVAAYLIVSVNQTNIQLSLDPSYAQYQPNAVLIPIGNGAALTSATREWLIGPLTGCTPASGGTSTTNKDNCAIVPVDISETGSQGSHHADIVFTFIDNQQAAYIQQYATDPAVTSYPAAGQTAGSPTGFGGFTPTGAAAGNSNSGNPNPLIKSTDSIINTY